MATVTYQHSSFSGVRIEFDVNTANWRMSQVRCINDSDLPARAWIYKDGALVFTADGPAHQTTSWNTTGIQLGWDTVDGGLIMDGYEMHAGWPVG